MYMLMCKLAPMCMAVGFSFWGGSAGPFGGLPVGSPASLTWANAFGSGSFPRMCDKTSYTLPHHPILIICDYLARSSVVPGC